MPAGSYIFWSTGKHHFVAWVLKILNALILGSANVLVMRSLKAETVVALNCAMNLCPMDEPEQSVVQPSEVFPSTVNSLTLSPWAISSINIT